MKLLSLSLIFSIVIGLSSCGGGESDEAKGLSKDSKVDFTMSVEELKAPETYDAGDKYDGKIVETKGYVREAKETKAAAAPSPYYFYLAASDAEGAKDMICYTPESADKWVGKTVNVKGEIEMPGSVGLKKCVIYE